MQQFRISNKIQDLRRVIWIRDAWVRLLQLSGAKHSMRRLINCLAAGVWSDDLRRLQTGIAYDCALMPRALRHQDRFHACAAFSSRWNSSIFQRIPCILYGIHRNKVGQVVWAATNSVHNYSWNSSLEQFLCLWGASDFDQLAFAESYRSKPVHQRTPWAQYATISSISDSFWVGSNTPSVASRDFLISFCIAYQLSISTVLPEGNCLL